MLTAKVTFKDDTANVWKAARKSYVRPLSRMGAYVRGVAMKSISKRKGPSDPGKPPHTHQGGQFSLKRSIFFNVQKAERNVLVGPIPMGKAGALGGLHEEGGRVAVSQSRIEGLRQISRAKIKRLRGFSMKIGGTGPLRRKGRLVYGGRIKTEAQLALAKRIARQIEREEAGRQGVLFQVEQTGTAVYPARPFMGPALERAEPRLAQMWEDTIHP